MSTVDEFIKNINDINEKTEKVVEQKKKMYLKILYYYNISTSKPIKDYIKDSRKDDIDKVINAAENEFKKTNKYTFFYIKEFQEDNITSNLSFTEDHIKTINENTSDKLKLKYIMEKVSSITFNDSHKMVEALKHFNKLN